MNLYVCGFCFIDDDVILIRKNKPEWQRGKLNGVGGKIESGETPEQAMVREFIEETGLDTSESDWNHFVTLESNKRWIVFFFVATLRNVEPQSITEEKVGIFPSNPLPSDCLPNLKWLIPIAKTNDLEFPIHIWDIGDIKE